jgi:MinD-like ATPase involved in chromosome partitioning or flagellar assembly
MHKVISDSLSSSKTYAKGKKISITGGASGVGKTSIALKMAKEYALSGERILLVDCDVNASHTLNKLGISHNGQFQKLLSGQLSLEETVVKADNFHLLIADSLLIDERKEDFEQILIDIIFTHEKDFDLIIIDSPSLKKGYFLKLNAICDYQIVITTPDRRSITESYSFIKALFQEFGIEGSYLFVNKFQDEKQFTKLSASLIETIKNFVGARTHIWGGMQKFNFDDHGFDTFFLSKSKNEINYNFVKLLIEFTEKAVGTCLNGKLHDTHQIDEQEVH